MTDEASIENLLRAQLEEVRAASTKNQIERLLIPPRLELRNWDYGTGDEKFPCWFVLEHKESNTGIAYCEEGFGPRCPWGLMFLSGEYLSMGADYCWYSRLDSAFVESMAYNENAEQDVDPNA